MKDSIIQFRVTTTERDAYEFLHYDCRFNMSELFRNFVMNLYETEKARRSV